jgi:cardiolipin synthase
VPSWLTIPNAITLLRIALVPVFLAFYLSGNAGAALACFIAAGVSDALDGFLARVLNQRSKLGTMLDPIADKLLGLAALIATVVHGLVPLWLLLLILFRDGAIAVGAAIARSLHVELPTTPTRIGKYATFSLTCLIVLTLVGESQVGLTPLRAYTRVVGVLTGLCVAISTGQYIRRFVVTARRQSSLDEKKRTLA